MSWATESKDKRQALVEKHERLWRDPANAERLVTFAWSVVEGFDVQTIVTSPAKSLEYSPRRWEKRQEFRDDSIPMLRVEIGTGLVASAFGVPLRKGTETLTTIFGTFQLIIAYGKKVPPVFHPQIMAAFWEKPSWGVNDRIQPSRRETKSTALRPPFASRTEQPPSAGAKMTPHSRLETCPSLSIPTQKPYESFCTFT